MNVDVQGRVSLQTYSVSASATVKFKGHVCSGSQEEGEAEKGREREERTTGGGIEVRRKDSG